METTGYVKREPQIMECAECGKMVIHHDNWIKGWRSGCCNA